MTFFKRSIINRLLKKVKSFQKQRAAQTTPTPAVVKKEIAYYHQLAKLYGELIGKKKFPFAREQRLECYRAAATLEDAQAKYCLAKDLIDEAKFRDALQHEGVFASAINERLAKQLFDEAIAYLIAADPFNHILAKRLLGLCYIRGWGVEVDQDKGFEYIVASIELEKSWDKVPQIFSAMDLNKPEFFAAFMQHRKQVS